ncbi:MAG: hypothetical protein R2882_15945 [Gemmatimonadales bacterium]
MAPAGSWRRPRRRRARRPKAEDVGSIDAIIAALYDVISGPAGQAQDWDRFKSLFAPGARLIPTGRDPAGKGRLLVWSPEEYAERAGANLEKNGFFEREIGRAMERYGNIVQVFSAYDSKRTAQDEKPFARGINSIQLFNDGSRWFVVTIFWESETPANPIPAQYLKPAR